MTEQPVQITNRKGDVIGSASMSDAFEKQMVRNTAYVMLINEQGKVWLQRRSLDSPNYPGYWDASAGGHIDVGESAETAAYRELEEELGIKDVPLNYLRSLYYEAEGDGRIYKYYAHIYVSRDFKLNHIELVSSEVAEVSLFSTNQLGRLDKVTPLTIHIAGLI